MLLYVYGGPKCAQAARPPSHIVGVARGIHDPWMAATHVRSAVCTLSAAPDSPMHALLGIALRVARSDRLGLWGSLSPSVSGFMRLGPLSMIVVYC